MEDYFKRSAAIRGGLAVCALIVVSLYRSCTELKDACYGVITPGTVVQCDQTAGRRGRGEWNLSVQARDQNGRPLRLLLAVGDRYGPFKVDDVVEVIYRPDAPEFARLTAQRSWTWPLILGGLVLAFVVWCSVVVARGMQGKL